MENDKDLLRVHMEQIKTQINVKEEKCNQMEVSNQIISFWLCTNEVVCTAAIAKGSERLRGVVRAAPDPARSRCRITE